MQKLADLVSEIRACQACAANLPHAPRPVMQAGERAGLLIVGQAPGRAPQQLLTMTGAPVADVALRGEC